MCKVACGSALRPEIRPAKKEDLTGLLALEEICFKEETFKKEQLTYLLLKAKSLVFVATVDNILIGSIIVLLRKNIAAARIYSLNIHPGYRRKGLAGLLLDTCEKSLKEMGIKKVTLEVGVYNHAAQDLYRSKGFSADRILKKYYKNMGDAIHLTKKL